LDTYEITKQLVQSLELFFAITDKLQNRYFDFWHNLLFNDNRVIWGNTAFRESGYNLSSPKIAILVADL
jgi:hypothetical protein